MLTLILCSINTGGIFRPIFYTTIGKINQRLHGWIKKFYSNTEIGQFVTMQQQLGECIYKQKNNLFIIAYEVKMEAEGYIPHELLILDF